MVITSRSTINSVFFLILDFISVGCLFIMVGAEFLGMILLIVYVGAVAVLFLFVVMMLNVAEQKQSWFIGRKSTHIPTGLIVSVLILLAVNINLISFSIFSGDIVGQIFTMLILTVAAAEAAIGLAIIVVYYRNRGSIRVEDIHGMKG